MNRFHVKHIIRIKQMKILNYQKTKGKSFRFHSLTIFAKKNFISI